MRVAYGAVPYITLEDAKRYLNINLENQPGDTKAETRDQRIQLLIDMACSAVEHSIERELVANTYTEIHNPGSIVSVKRYPIQEVYEVKLGITTLENPGTSGQAVFDTNEEVVDFSLSKDAAISKNHSKFGDYSLKLSKTDSFIEADEVPSKMNIDDSDFTVEMWINSNSAPSNEIYRHGTDENSFAIKIESNTLKVTANNVDVISQAITYPARKWNHIAFTKNYEKGEGYAHFNGALLASNTDFNASFNYTGSVKIGNFIGYVDEVRVSKTARYSNANFTVAEHKFSTDQDTVLLMHFENANGEIRDSSATVPGFTYRKSLGLLEGFNSEAGLPITVTYKGGYDPVLDDIKVATLEYVRLLYQNSLTELTRAVGSQRIQNFGSARPEFPPQVENVLKKYRRRTI